MSKDKLAVKIGAGYVLDSNLEPRTMTREQAKRLGERTMPADLKRRHFETFVSEANHELHGGRWFRINYGYRG